MALTNAARLSRTLQFKNNEIKQPRLVAASDVLLNLGLLAASDSQRAACKYLSERASDNMVDDGNSTVVYKQISNEHIPVFEQNIKGALKQYLNYLSPQEAKPFLLLVKPQRHDIKMSKDKNTEIENAVNDNTQYILNVNAPLTGNLQQGKNNKAEANINTPTKEKTIIPIITGIISTVLGGLVLYYLIEYVKQ